MVGAGIEISQGVDQELEWHLFNNIGVVHLATGKPDQALKLFELALSITRESGDKAGEATTLSDIAGVYSAIGQQGKALELYEQVLPIMREVGHRAGEAVTLNNIAMVEHAMDQPGKMLELYEQALSIYREMGDRAGEAATINNIAGVYHAIDQSSKALELFEQTLPITREVGDRALEAATLNNMAVIYSVFGLPGKALELHQQALSISHEVSDLAGEAATLSNIGGIYMNVGQPDKALTVVENALKIANAIGARQIEANLSYNMAILLYTNLKKASDAIQHLEQAIDILRQLHLSQIDSRITIQEMQSTLKLMKSGRPISGGGKSSRGLSPRQVQMLMANTLAVLTNSPDKRSKWRESIVDGLKRSQVHKTQTDSEFLIAILALLDGKAPEIAPKNPYAKVIQSIVKQLSTVAVSPCLPVDFAERCTAGLTGKLQEKMSLLDTLAGMAKDYANPGEQALIDIVQKALFGTPPESLERELPEEQAHIWQEIVRRVKLM